MANFYACYPPISSTALPTGAATAANQVIENALLTTIASSIGVTGAAVPADAIQIAGAYSGSSTLIPVKVGADGTVAVSGTISVVPGTNTVGSYAEKTNLTNVAQSFTVPTNAVGFCIEALSDNSANIRYKLGGTATTTSGMRLEPGRSENYSNFAAVISVICETSATNQVVSVQWFLSS